MANILMNYALGATLTLCPELSAFGLSARGWSEAARRVSKHKPFSL
ncbi:MAG: hypothetical protein ACI3Z6_02705 [Candidatus Onthomorpha sp.]